MLVLYFFYILTMSHDNLPGFNFELPFAYTHEQTVPQFRDNFIFQSYVGLILVYIYGA